MGERAGGKGEGCSDLEARGVDGGHDDGPLGCHIVLRKPEGLLHDLGHHGGGGAIPQYFLDNLSCVRHLVQHFPGDAGLQVRPQTRLLLPDLHQPLF